MSVSTLGNIVNLGVNALRAQQVGLSVTGNNIANVNTPGYSRQRAALTTSLTINGLGSGVELGVLTRARDLVLDRQHRFESGQVGRLEFLENAMATIEAIFTEVAGGGSTETGAIFNQASGAALTGAFSRFFNAFQDLANNPESQATRAAVREEGSLLTEQFHRMDAQLSRMRDDLEAEFSDTVAAVNRLTDEIARLNAQIMSDKENTTEVAGNLDDERDRLIDELSTLIGASAKQQSDGTITIQAAVGEGILLVQGGSREELAVSSLVRDGAVVSDLVFASTGARVEVNSGKLAGILETRDVKLVDFEGKLDETASVFVERFNIQHAAGFGIDGSSSNLFFDPGSVSARTIQVADNILTNLDTVATDGPSASNANISAGTGDGTNALALSDIRLEKLFGGGTQTVEEFYSDFIGEVGAEAKSVFMQAEGQRLVLEQIDNRRENLRGVSINEEASQLIVFQRAYQAAARAVSVADEMMQAVLNI
ncbi:MAG: flagellar hook-associated protein FlgK [Gemmatimonadetes bacterium]|nr:flagellar hook-associated protein FlgK [Gemmatimonadota bacterium]